MSTSAVPTTQQKSAHLSRPKTTWGLFPWLLALLDKGLAVMSTTEISNEMEP